MELKLEKANLQIETELGVIDINQIEDSTCFSIEIFPPNQDKDSFENAEFNNIVDINREEDSLNPDFFNLVHHPRNWTWEQKCEMNFKAHDGLMELLKTCTNLGEQRDTKFFGILILYNNNFCSFCGKDISNNEQKENLTNRLTELQQLQEELL